MDQIGAALTVIGVLGFLALLIKWGGMGKYAELQRLHETQKQILDKIGSGPEMIQFIGSKEGKELFEQLRVPPQTRRKADSSSAFYGLNEVMTMMGLGFFAAGSGVGLLVTNCFYHTIELLMWGCILACGGIGLLIASGPFGGWSGRLDSNQRPYGPEPYALPNCATPRLMPSAKC